MQVFPADILRLVFKLVPSKDLHRISQVCKRFRGIIDEEVFWKILLKDRFRITEIPENSKYKAFYLNCVGALKTIKQPIMPAGLTVEGAAKALPNGFTSSLTYVLNESETLELDKNILRLRCGNLILSSWNLIPSTYFVEIMHDDYWAVRSPHATYLLNLPKRDCILVAGIAASLFIRGPFLFIVGERLYVKNINSQQTILEGLIYFNNKSHIYHLSHGEVAFVTQDNRLILVRQNFLIYQIPSFFEPEERLNEEQIVVKQGDSSKIFNLKTNELIDVNLGSFSFLMEERIAFYRNDKLFIHDTQNLGLIASYDLKHFYDILCIQPDFMLARPHEEPQPGRSLFHLFYLKEMREFEFSRLNMVYIGNEAFFLVFARLEAAGVLIIWFNALTQEFVKPSRLIHNFQFRSAIRITNTMEALNGEFLVVTYRHYTLKIKAILKDFKGEYKITSYHYKY